MICFIIGNILLFETFTNKRNSLLKYAYGVGISQKLKKIASSMDEEFEKAQKLNCLRNRRRKWHENEIVCGKSISRLIKFLLSLNKRYFISYIFVCLRKNQRKWCFKHFVHGQFDFQQLELLLFMDEGFLHSITNYEL